MFLRDYLIVQKSKKKIKHKLFLLSIKYSFVNVYIFYLFRAFSFAGCSCDKNGTCGCHKKGKFWCSTDECFADAEDNCRYVFMKRYFSCFLILSSSSLRH